MAVLKLQTNVREEIALAYTSGKPVEGNYGPQVMFTLADGRQLYLSQAAAEKIDALGLEKGEPFQIVKAERANGQRKYVEYEVKRVYGPGQFTETGTPAPAPREAATPRGVPDGDGQVQDRRFTTQAIGGNQPHATAAAVVEAPYNARPLTTLRRVSVGDQMLSAGCVALDVLHALEQHAKAKHGWEIEFNAEDVRAMMNTIFIQMSKDGGAL